MLKGLFPRNAINRIRTPVLRYRYRSFHALTSKIQQKSMSLKTTQPLKEPPPQPDLINKLHEQLISEINTNLHHPTHAQNQADSMEIFQDLSMVKWCDDDDDARLNEVRKQLIVQVLLDLLNDEFYSIYNDKFLRSLELDKQSHLFNSLSSEIKYIIQNSRDAQLNDHHLKLMKLIRDLDTIQDEIQDLIINDLNQDCQLEFNNQKLENTLLYKNINLNLNGSSNKIAIKILAELKSHIEEFRWQTTRNGLLALLVLVFLILTGVNMSKKYTTTNENAEKEIDLTNDKYLLEHTNENDDENGSHTS
ncbi:hypothetical protein NCAS_0D02980 [Naumovozyma castellii]|uniref:Uncharacterized protein n=1 Tax=Naumovozyma castellii TaxID=27288 RepID=G0VE88_NAUCA|nr:hypothetical protein NCAS_0D02980 [Naumovozyma castellii CBS 4309]CCC69879.1 hypothetical protein NCAS_0D02980 [Naumovozyma castellii CBS 4309]